MARDISRIIVHCSYTPPSMDIGADTIRAWHVEERGWSDIGYHYVVRRNGEIEDGRPVERMGAHARGNNSDSIGICLVGGMAEDGGDDCNFTRWQWEALSVLVDSLDEEYGHLEVIGHRDVDDSKTCPTFDAIEWGSE
jgi:N-acetyl-anhydromuramyl-L-alanine amidase AmpD